VLIDTAKRTKGKVSSYRLDPLCSSSKLFKVMSHVRKFLFPPATNCELMEFVQQREGRAAWSTPGCEPRAAAGATRRRAWRRYRSDGDARRLQGVGSVLIPLRPTLRSACSGKTWAPLSAPRGRV